MPVKTATEVPARTETPKPSDLQSRYGCGTLRLAGVAGALYQRHLLFDNAIDPNSTTSRDRFEAVALSVRDVLSQRWVLTENTYQTEKVKRGYYLSMEFLIGRSLANNVANLMLDGPAKAAIQSENLDWIDLLEQEPDAGLGNGGLGRLAACFIESAATLQLPVMGYGLRYEYGIFRQRMQDGWQAEEPDNWLRRQDPWEVRRPNDRGHDRTCVLLRIAWRESARRWRHDRQPCTGFLSIVRLWATVARRLTPCACGRRRCPVLSIFRNSAAAIS